MTPEEICMEQVVQALSRLTSILDDARMASTYGAIQERVIRAGGPSDVPGASKLADLATVDLQDVHNDICKVWKKVYRMQNTAERLEELARLRGAVRHA